MPRSLEYILRQYPLCRYVRFSPSSSPPPPPSVSSHNVGAILRSVLFAFRSDFLVRTALSHSLSLSTYVIVCTVRIPIARSLPPSFSPAAHLTRPQAIPADPCFASMLFHFEIFPLWHYSPPIPLHQTSCPFNSSRDQPSHDILRAYVFWRRFP